MPTARMLGVALWLGLAAAAAAQGTIAWQFAPRQALHYRLSHVETDDYPHEMIDTIWRIGAVDKGVAKAAIQVARVRHRSRTHYVDSDTPKKAAGGPLKRAMLKYTAALVRDDVQVDVGPTGHVTITTMPAAIRSLARYHDAFVFPVELPTDGRGQREWTINRQRKTPRVRTHERFRCAVADTGPGRYARIDFTLTRDVTFKDEKEETTGTRESDHRGAAWFDTTTGCLVHCRTHRLREYRVMRTTDQNAHTTKPLVTVFDRIRPDADAPTLRVALRSTDDGCECTVAGKRLGRWPDVGPELAARLRAKRKATGVRVVSIVANARVSLMKAAALVDRCLQAGLLVRYATPPPIPEDELNRMTAKSDLRSIGFAIRTYRTLRRKLPETLDDAARFFFPDRKIPVDPWGRPYHYEVTGKAYTLYTLGADGEPGGTGPNADLHAKKKPKTSDDRNR